LLWSTVALVFFLVLIGFVLDVIASVQQASAEQNLP
jgi:ABC-type iron transport system FetAB permease component